MSIYHNNKEKQIRGNEFLREQGRRAYIGVFVRKGGNDAVNYLVISKNIKF